MPSLPLRRWAPVVAFVALAGLFAMHGLGDHSSPTAAGHGHAHHAMSAPADGAPTTSPAGGLADGTGVAVVCFGILLGAALALVLLHLRDRRTPWRAARTSWRPRSVPAARDPDPPPLALLSVCRC